MLEHQVLPFYKTSQMVLNQSPYLRNSLNKSVKLFGDLDIPNFHNETETYAIDDELSSLISNTYTKTEVDNLLTNINLNGSENINITSNQTSLSYPFKNNNEAFLNPRVNDYFEIYAAPNGISILQHISDGSQPIAIFNPLDKSVEFFGDLDIPNFYNKAEADNLITNLNLLNYYTKNQVDTLISSISLVDYYTKAKIDTRLTGYVTTTYSQANCMTSMSITETLMNNYASITCLVDDFYDKAYLDHQITSLISTDYLNFKYTNGVDLSTDYYNKIETGNLLANKVSTTGDASVSGNLEVQRLYITNSTARPIEINNTMNNGPYLAAISQNHSNNDLSSALRCLPLHQLRCFGVSTSNRYIISHENSTKLSIQSNGNTTISGN